MTTEYFVDANVIAEHLGVERRTVLHMARTGRLPAHPINPSAGKKLWRFKLSEVDAAITGNLAEKAR